MDFLIEQLCNSHTNIIKKNIYKSDNAKTINFYEKEEEDYSLFVSLNIIDDTNYIFLNIINHKKVIYKCLFNKSDKSLV